jgi:hypothetical protein
MDQYFWMNKKTNNYEFKFWFHPLEDSNGQSTLNYNFIGPPEFGVKPLFFRPIQFFCNFNKLTMINGVLEKPTFQKKILSTKIEYLVTVFKRKIHGKICNWSYRWAPKFYSFLLRIYEENGFKNYSILWGKSSTI